jgi:heptosyltransferase-3
MWGKGWFYTHANVKRNHRQHMVEQNLDIVRQIGVDTADRRLSFVLSREEETFADGLFEAHGIRKEDLKIHMHPTSRWLFKCWQDKSFALLMDRLSAEYQARIIVTCGPAPREVARAERIMAQVKSKPLQLIGRTTLRELGAIAKACDLFIGVDSAPMHLAAAVGTPTIALFGPSRDDNWHPWCVEHLVLKKNAGCNPGGPTGCTQTKRCLCLEKISVAEVMEAVRQQLQKRRQEARA